MSTNLFSITVNDVLYLHLDVAPILIEKYSKIRKFEGFKVYVTNKSRAILSPLPFQFRYDVSLTKVPPQTCGIRDIYKYATLK